MNAGMQDPGDVEGDEIVRCVLADVPVRVVAALTTRVAQEAVRRHQAGAAGAIALGRGLTAGLLLATLTKDDEQVTLQVLGDGPLGGITVDASGAGTARAYVRHPGAGPSRRLPARCGSDRRRTWAGGCRSRRA